MNLLTVRQDTVSPFDSLDFIAQCVPFLQKDIVCIGVSDRIKFTNVFHYISNAKIKLKKVNQGNHQ